MRDSVAPPGAYFRVHPESDAMIFPFSQYPKSLPGGTPISILQLDLEMLHSAGHRMFFVATTRSQTCPFRTERAQCHVVFALGKDAEICSKLMKEMDIHNNQILYRDKVTKGTFERWILEVIFRMQQETIYPRRFAALTKGGEREHGRCTVRCKSL